jgi:hypothetical protein
MSDESYQRWRADQEYRPAPELYHAHGTQPAPRGNGVAVAALVLGITCVVFSWWGLFSLVQWVLAVTFGAVGLSRTRRGAPNKGMAIAGITLGIIGGVIYFFLGLASLGVGWFI